MTEDQEIWLPVTKAARALGIHPSSFNKMLKRLAETGRPVRTRKDIFNKTLILVNVDEIREALKDRIQDTPSPTGK